MRKSGGLESKRSLAAYQLTITSSEVCRGRDEDGLVPVDLSVEGGWRDYAILRDGQRQWVDGLNRMERGGSRFAAGAEGARNSGRVDARKEDPEPARLI